jgi:hypothetical protein
VLRQFAHDVDEYISAEESTFFPVRQEVKDYVRSVERAASDLGSRKERASVLSELMEPVFQSGPPPQ